jgi:hypothetical protein
MYPKTGDLVFGSIGTFTTFLVGHFDHFLGVIAGMMTIFGLALRIRREWIHRNDKPDDKNL